MHSRTVSRGKLWGRERWKPGGSRGIGVEYSGCLLYYGLPLGYAMMVLESSG
jgi:hypothetical protein